MTYGKGREMLTHSAVQVLQIKAGSGAGPLRLCDYCPPREMGETPSP